MERWSDKIALVTGAGSGIGAAITEELVKNGLKVIGLDIQVEKVEELKNKLEGEKGALFPIKGDVTKDEDIKEVFEWIKNKFASIHVVINNAGIFRSGEFLTMDPKHCRDIINTNLMGPSVIAQQAFKLMRDSGVDDGHIVFINSVAGHPAVSFPGISLNMYPSSKFAITALVETIRHELKIFESNIRVTSVSPGSVDTNITRHGLAALGSEFVEKVPFKIGPPLKPKDIADGVIYALSTPPRVQVRELTIAPNGSRF